LILGTISLADPDNGYVARISSDSIMHEQYNNVSADNDIALIKLPLPVEFSRKYLNV
jgi:hypothetical protein